MVMSVREQREWERLKAQKDKERLFKEKQDKRNAKLAQIDKQIDRAADEVARLMARQDFERNQTKFDMLSAQLNEARKNLAFWKQRKRELD